MKPRLMQYQTLHTKMNQTLLQSIHLLQYNGVELMDYINQLAKENPLIEEVNYDFEMEHFRKSSDPKNHPDIGEINKTEDTMYDYLKKQLIALNYPKKLQTLIEYGIDSLNEDGYLEVELAEWMEDCQSTLLEVEEALDVIQSLEPAGVGARTLTECILLQLDRSGLSYGFVEELLNNHLEWIANEDIDAISEQYEITEKLAKDIVNEVRLCHPKPGQLLDTKTPEYIIPEASIFKENHNWKIKFYKWAAPTIIINPDFQHLKGLEKETDKYLREKYKEVEWLQQVIHFRKRTLEKVIEVIVEKQLKFFEVGVKAIQPLTLREIASEVDSHISTVSRTVSQKYVQTPYGVFPIKFFMQSGIKQQNGMKVASTVIKQYILQIIEKEDKAKPLSDQGITNELLQEYGIQIARRTVMKYREQLQIPSSMKRRRKN